MTMLDPAISLGFAVAIFVMIVLVLLVLNSVCPTEEEVARARHQRRIAARYPETVLSEASYMEAVDADVAPADLEANH